MRSILFAMLVAAGFALTGTSGANAAAANGTFAGKATEATSGQVIEVRDRCGRHRHWSKWKGRCVWN